MKLQDFRCRKTGAGISRRVAVGSGGLVVLGVLSRSVLGQENREARDKARENAQERMEEFRAFSERMRDASPEERMKIMEERRAQDHQKAIEGFKDRLGISDKDWAVVKPRIEKVYDLTHPLPQMRAGNEAPKNEVEHRSGELRDLPRDERAAVDKIKAGLAALRAAKEKANQELIKAKQDLRQLMTVHQEAELVLSGLLD